MARKAQVKVCTKTGRTFKGAEIAENFYRDKSQKDGFSPWCKDAERAYNRAYRAGLKKANAPKKGEIADEKGRAAFEREMKSERVTRTRKAPVKVTRVTRTRKAKA